MKTLLTIAVLLLATTTASAQVSTAEAYRRLQLRQSGAADIREADRQRELSINRVERIERQPQPIRIAFVGYRTIDHSPRSGSLGVFPYGGSSFRPAVASGYGWHCYPSYPSYSCGYYSGCYRYR